MTTPVALDRLTLTDRHAIVQPSGAEREPSFAFVGFGALAEAFAMGLRDGGAVDVAAFARPCRDAEAARALRRRLASAGVRSCASVEETAKGADVIVAAVPAAAAGEVAAACSSHLRSGALYVDPTPLPPTDKAELAAMLDAAGAQYADVAVMGTVAVDAHAVPMLAAGPGATRWAATVAPFGFRVSHVDGPPGRASLVKLLRSVYMKGRDALILEMLVAARRHGVEDAVLQSIGGAWRTGPLSRTGLAGRPLVGPVRRAPVGRADGRRRAPGRSGRRAAGDQRRRGAPALARRLRRPRALRRRATGRHAAGPADGRRARSSPLRRVKGGRGRRRRAARGVDCAQNAAPNARKTWAPPRVSARAQPLQRGRRMRSGEPWPTWRSLSSRALALATALVTLLWAVAIGAAGAAAADPTIAAVGDMACSPTDSAYNAGNGTASRCRQRYVSDLVVGALPDALLDLGDNQYVNGELAELHSRLRPHVRASELDRLPEPRQRRVRHGRRAGLLRLFLERWRLRPYPGRLGGRVAPLSGGYYSFDIGAWHLIALNSNCAEVGGCGAGSPQETWLKADLAAHPGRCTLAYWHHPRWNAGNLGNDSSTAAFWTDLYNARADLVLNGHGNHHYERFLPQSPAGAPDPTKGIREFIVSTGGESHGSPPRAAQHHDDGGLGLHVLRRAEADPASDRLRLAVRPGHGGSSRTREPAPATPQRRLWRRRRRRSPPTRATRRRLSWTAPAGRRRPDHRLQRLPGRPRRFRDPAEELGNVTSYDDLSAANATKYFYRVAAINSAGEGAKSDRGRPRRRPRRQVPRTRRSWTTSRAPPARSAQAGSPRASRMRAPSPLGRRTGGEQRRARPLRRGRPRLRGRPGGRS